MRKIFGFGELSPGLIMLVFQVILFHTTFSIPPFDLFGLTGQ
jgi:hypothetical protein